MATAPVPSFAPTGVVSLPVNATSSSVQLPSTGSPAIAVVTNLGEQIAFIALGDDTIEASASTSLAILPHGSLALTLGANAYLAGITLAGVSQLNIAVGN